MVMFLPVSFFFYFLCFFLLVMLVEGESAAPDRDSRCNLFFDFVLVSMLWVFFLLMLLVLRNVEKNQKKIKS